MRLRKPYGSTFPSIQTCNIRTPSAVQIPLHQNIPNDTSLLAIRTNLLSLQLLESRSSRSVGILAQSIDPQEAELVPVVVRVLFVAPMAIEGEPIDGISETAVRNIQ